jgi:hypothetical protein
MLKAYSFRGSKRNVFDHPPLNEAAVVILAAKGGEQF